MKNRKSLLFLLLVVSLMVSMTACLGLNGTNGGFLGNNNSVATGETYKITYYISNNDNYLASLDIKNENPTEYDSGLGIVLNDLIVPGYVFKGWYNAQIGGDRISEILPGTKGNKVLYAQWEKVEYTITFDSPDVPVESIKYTVDTGAPLKNAEWYGYTFVGWSNDNGFIVNSIKPGTTGNITLHANWTSNRNKATSYENYGAPIIIENAESGVFLFVYDIGKIDNVPLYEIKDLGNTQRLEFEEELTIVDYISSEQADTIRESVMNATTNSSGWVLSEEWNSIYTEGTEEGTSQTKTEERVDSQGNVIGGQYFVSNSSGGSSYTSLDSGASTSSSSKVTTDTSYGINASYDKSTEKYSDAKLYANNTTEASVGATIPVKVVDVSASVKNTTTVGAELTSGRKDNSAFHIDGNYSNYVGTVDENNNSAYYNASVSSGSTWNSQQSYTSSYQTSIDTSIRDAISNEITKTTSYGVSQALGGEQKATSDLSNTESKENEYSSTFMYSTGTSSTTSEIRKFYSDMPGYYRIVMAGTVHVYAVVGYDVATSSYFTYTYSVLDDERHTYLDYSKDNANFDDCENGIITFEIPYEVNEYVMGVTGRSDGLEFDLNGNVTDFETPENFDGHIVVPQYYASNNLDGTYSANMTLAFNPVVFKGNTNITTVILPMYITEIPASAFEGCTNLETVIAYGVTKIGANAFKGCESLKTFAIDNKIEYLGSNAFEGVSDITAMASSSEVAKAVINSGAKRITLDITLMRGSLDNYTIDISDNTEFFKLIGGGRTANNLMVHSDAQETFISNITFVGNTDTPICLSSEVVTLARVNVQKAPGFALVLKADDTLLKLYDTIRVSSVTQKSVLSKNIKFTKAGNASSGILEVNGQYLICGAILNEDYAKYLISDIAPQVIDEKTFTSYTRDHIISFDPNGGYLDERDESKEVSYGKLFGTFPIPTRDNYTFGGWYTSSEGGTHVTEDLIFVGTSDQTLYAHWTYNSYVLSFNPNGGNVLNSYKIVTYNNKVGTLPVPTRDYYNFLGWYDANGSKITADTIYNLNQNLTVTARWELKPITGWTKVENLPEGAHVIDSKWTYTNTETKESLNTSESGWVLVGSYWRESGSGSAEYASFPDGYLTTNSYYTSMNKQPFTAYENSTSRREVVNSWTGYIYWHYMYNTKASAYYRCIRDEAGTASNYNDYVYKDTYFRAFKDATSYTKLGQYYDYGSGTTLVSCGTHGYATYLAKYGKSNSETSGSCFWYRFDYYTSSYTDYVKVFQYQKITNCESEYQVTEGNGISNVQQWVQYRER